MKTSSPVKPLPKCWGRRGGLGYIPDLRDHRDLHFTPTITHLPSAVSLRAQMPPVLDQGNLGSCTAHGLTTAYRFALRKETIGPAPVFSPSRLMLYYLERAMEGTISSDAGAAIRDGAKALNNFGVCDEATWPYDIAKFAQRPPQAAYVEALKHESIIYRRVAATEAAIKACLASGFPVVVGATLYASFESDLVARTGKVPMPKRGEAVLGGHCFVVDQYDDGARTLGCMNSWGTAWGDAGFFTLPTGYLAAHGSDYWMIQTVAR